MLVNKIMKMSKCCNWQFRSKKITAYKEVIKMSTNYEVLWIMEVNLFHTLFFLLPVLSVIIILEQIDIVNSVQVLLIISLYYRRAITTCFTDWYCLQYVDSELLKASCIHFSLIIVHYYVLQNDSPSEKSQDIIAHLTSLLILQCQCNINMNTVITNGGFQCFANSPELVTYRAQLQGTSEVAALEFVQILQQWVSSGPSIK